MKVRELRLLLQDVNQKSDVMMRHWEHQAICVWVHQFPSGEVSLISDRSKQFLEWNQDAVNIMENMTLLAERWIIKITFDDNWLEVYEMNEDVRRFLDNWWTPEELLK